MNKFFTILFFFVITGIYTYGQGIVVDNAYLVISSNAFVTISGSSGSFTNQNFATTDLNGTLTLQKDLSNGATLNSSSGNVVFNGTISQALNNSSVSTFNNFTENNSSGLSLNNKLFVNNQLTMTLGNINMNYNEITLGVSTASPGTLSRISGFLYGFGKFTRWFDNSSSILIGNVKGLFPMGDSISNYRPFWFGTATALTSGGTMSITHNPCRAGHYPLIAGYTDDTWNGGTLVAAVSKAAWNVSTANGLAINPNDGSVRFGGEGFAPFSCDDINASLVNSKTGSYDLAIGSCIDDSYLLVDRFGLQTIDLNLSWHVGTHDKTTSPLPVELLSFTGVCNNSMVVLNWVTATETNNSFFTIEKSDNGINWSAIAHILGAGSSNHIENYSYTDEKFNGNAVYYMLKQTDNDGLVSSFAPILVSCNSSNDVQVEVTPNPFNDVIKLGMKRFPYTNAKITIFDIIGNKIREQIISGINNQMVNTTFDMGILSSGMYFIEISATGFSKNIKIVKN